MCFTVVSFCLPGNVRIFFFFIVFVFYVFLNRLNTIKQLAISRMLFHPQTSSYLLSQLFVTHLGIALMSFPFYILQRMGRRMKREPSVVPAVLKTGWPKNQRTTLLYPKSPPQASAEEAVPSSVESVSRRLFSLVK